MMSPPWPRLPATSSSPHVSVLLITWYLPSTSSSTSMLYTLPGNAAPSSDHSHTIVAAGLARKEQATLRSSVLTKLRAVGRSRFTEGGATSTVRAQSRSHVAKMYYLRLLFQNTNFCDLEYKLPYGSVDKILVSRH